MGPYILDKEICQMGAARKGWTRQQLLVAFNLYCQLPFGKLHYQNSEIIEHAEYIGRTPSALAMKLANIASLDPVITSTGRRGLKKSSRLDRQMWEEMQNNWEGFVVDSEQALDEVKFQTQSAPSEFSLPPDFSGENKPIKTTARVGQSFFRKAVLSAYNSKCCISGLSEKRLLVASHIIPWRVDESNRLNPRNGLLLSMLHDKAFDLGIITVSDDMTVMISRKSIMGDGFFDQSIRSYEGKKVLLPEKFQPHTDFLSYHREHIFEN